MVEIQLSPGDVAYATIEAVSRYNFNRARGNDESGSAAPTWVEQLSRDVSGALGELAIGRWVDKFPFAIFADRKLGDVGEFEVRTTAYSTGRLLIGPNDNPERKYLFVTLPNFHTANIVGWMWGYEAQQDCYWDTKMRIPTYSVPQKDLHTPASLL